MKKENIKATISTMLMILVVTPKFTIASPMPAATGIECELDPNLCVSSHNSDPPEPTSNGLCTCNGNLSETHTAQWARNGFEFFEEEHQKPIEGIKLGQKVYGKQGSSKS